MNMVSRFIRETFYQLILTSVSVKILLLCINQKKFLYRVVSALQK